VVLLVINVENKIGKLFVDRHLQVALMVTLVIHVLVTYEIDCLIYV